MANQYDDNRNKNKAHSEIGRYNWIFEMISHVRDILTQRKNKMEKKKNGIHTCAISDGTDTFSIAHSNSVSSAYCTEHRNTYEMCIN